MAARVPVALGQAEQAQMLEVGERLALGHTAPHRRAEQLVRQVDDRGRTEVLGDLSETGQALLVVLMDGLAPSGEVGERESVGRQDQLDVGYGGHRRQRLLERGERIATGTEPGDVRGDRGQDVVPGQQQTGFWVVQADVVEGVPRGVQHEPVATGQA